MISTLAKVDDQALYDIASEKKIWGTEDVFILFPLGSQFDHLISQMLGRIGVFCIVADPSRITVEDISRLKPSGIILSGGPDSMYDNPLKLDRGIFDLRIPVLGICLGFQYLANHVGCKVVKGEKAEFGTHKLTLKLISPLFTGCKNNMPVLESHGDKVEPNSKIKILGTTENAPVAAARFGHLWGVQFHPEVTETEEGQKIFENFCFIICSAQRSHLAISLSDKKINELRNKIGDTKVLLALSGGLDSSTVAYLLRRP